MHCMQSNAELQADGKTWEGFICNMKMLMQRTEHGLVTTACKAHKSRSQRKPISESDPSDDEAHMILNVRINPTWDDHSSMNACCDDMSIPPRAWTLMHNLDPNFLHRFVKA